MNTEYYYALPDIHGMKLLLDKALGFIRSKHPEGCKIIFLGDYIDRGPDNFGVLQAVMNPMPGFSYVTLRGNHEQMFVDSYLNGRSFYDHAAAIDISRYSGNIFTYDQICSSIDVGLIKWMDNLPYFHIEDKNVFAHAYYNDTLEPDNQNPVNCVWHRMGRTEHYDNRKQGYYLTHGHTPELYGPIQTENRTNLDCGAVFYDRLVIAKYKYGVQGPIDFVEFG